MILLVSINSFNAIIRLSSKKKLQIMHNKYYAISLQAYKISYRHVKSVIMILDKHIIRRIAMTEKNTMRNTHNINLNNESQNVIIDLDRC